ncbi:hypothetical protein GOEFS_045_00050 [Gordonia effusa NBRC 100432]|uniref:Integral membrane protein n=1 Tax=Gordonia effusa NBRC 100432 TaxID=1077974 RepID=H0QYW4_9ACTN|nr:hypothetical protein [Gordonia effusa]GAB18015.1 hypothetical protein GOEFS_045_00050 [Gordonia effusa NBRC 100432]
METVLKLITHGVSGTPAATMLGIAEPKVRSIETYGGKYSGTFSASSDDLKGTAPPERVGYRWSSMTAGTLRQLLWITLLPFALINVAWWMLPSDEVGPGRIKVLKALYRALGVFLTAIVTLQTMVIVVDLVFDQYLRHRTTPDWLSDAWLLSVIAIAIVIGAASLFHRLSQINTDGDDVDEPSDVGVPAADGSSCGLARDEFMFCTDSSAPALQTAHGLMVFGVATAYCSGWPFVDSQTTPWDVVLGLVGWVIAVGAALLAAFTHNPRGRGIGVAISGVFAGWAGFAWVAASALVFIATAIWILPTTQETNRLTEVSSWTVLVAGAAYGVVLLCAAILLGLCQGGPAVNVDGYRPWLRGMHSACVATLAGLIGFTAGIAISIVVQTMLTPAFKWDSVWSAKAWATLLVNGGSKFQLPWVYEPVARMWGVTVVVVVLVALTWYLTAARWSVRDRLASAARLQAEGLPVWAPATEDETPTAMDKALRSSWKRAGAKLLIPSAILLVVVVAVLTGVIFLSVNSMTMPSCLASLLDLLANIGQVAVVIAFVTLCWTVVRSAFPGNAVGRRSLGVLWDLASFWPREAHPVVPPSYAPRALRDISRYVNSRDVSRVVLCGHSQGSVLMYAAAHRILEWTEKKCEVSLFTYGSQLRWAYGRAFPAYLNLNTHVELLDHIDSRWINMTRYTDYIGDSVLSREQADEEWFVIGTLNGEPSWVGANQGPLIVGESIPFGQNAFGRYVGTAKVKTTTLPIEVWLLDPVGDPFGGGQALRKHSGYTWSEAGPSDTNAVWEWCIEQLSSDNS